ncbi:MAG: ABC transporter ATP-binding protein [Acidobacteria bacterium]|nr:ABC transporter ATP-binding protein [Acidobacteriota bacterium]
MIELIRASLRYGDILGLSPTSFQLPDGGGITGLLGPNGAGKSTLIQMISGLLPPSGGEVKVVGGNPFRNPDVLRHIGLVPEGDRLPVGLKGRGWLRMMGELSGLTGTELDEAVTRTLQRVDMTERADLPFQSMSKGMRQRMRLAQALLIDPKVLILDEPFNGLDPQGRISLMALLRDLAASGTRILVSSHILGEVAMLTDHILLLFRGRLLAEGTVGEIRALLDRHPVELRLKGADLDKVAHWSVAQPELAGLRMEEEALVLSVRSPHDFLPRFQAEVAAGRLAVASLDPLDLNLDAVFQYLTKDHA